ncbi:hypothetical protein [Dyella silvatica]|uniref:hypothetical protein n=1 Tax=Dyella silvatica TaxID=2992128 RepID=UPI00224E5200|nr:hypothetical protein [Dyella silvatica]
MLLTMLMLRSQRSIVRSFEQAGAIDGASARSPEQLGVRAGMAWYQLVGLAVLRCPGEGRYYLDRANWLRLRQRRRKTALIVGLALLILLAALVAWRLR